MSKIIKNKKLMLVVSICLFAVSTVVYTNAGNVVVYASNNSEIMKSVTGELYGIPKVVQDDSIYEDMFEEELITYQDDNYIYLFNNGGTNIKAIILVDMPEEPLFRNISSTKQAEETALTIISEANPDFFEQKYEITSRENGEDNNTYTVEIREKYDDNFYTGNKIAVIVTSDGYLDSMVSRTTEQPNVTRSNNSGFIDESTAIGNAYDALEVAVQDLEVKENQLKSANTKVQDEPIVSDASLLSLDVNANDVKMDEAEPYEIMLDNKEGQTIDSYKEVNEGVVEWVISVSNVSTNRFWGDMNFIVNINANTGEVNSITYTR